RRCHRSRLRGRRTLDLDACPSLVEVGGRVARTSAVERRGQLIEAGLRVIAREGMHGATVRAIVAEADVPLATFHYVFASREEMIGEAYAYIAVQSDDSLAGLVPDGAAPED